MFFDDDLHSPLTRELTVARRHASSAAAGRVRTYVNRHATDFVEDFITIDGGTTIINRNGLSGVFDNIVYRNTDLRERRVPGPRSASRRYRPRANAVRERQWTVQLENDGNFEGESAEQPGGALAGSATIRRSSSPIAASRWTPG